MASAPVSANVQHATLVLMKSTRISAEQSWRNSSRFRAYLLTVIGYVAICHALEPFGASIDAGLALSPYPLTPGCSGALGEIRYLIAPYAFLNDRLMACAAHQHSASIVNGSTGGGRLVTLFSCIQRWRTFLVVPPYQWSPLLTDILGESECNGYCLSKHLTKLVLKFALVPLSSYLDSLFSLIRIHPEAHACVYSPAALTGPMGHQSAASAVSTLVIRSPTRPVVHLLYGC